jgi:hypothetical protein
MYRGYQSRKKTPSIYVVEKKNTSLLRKIKKPSRRRRPRRPKAGEKKTKTLFMIG